MCSKIHDFCKKYFPREEISSLEKLIEEDEAEIARLKENLDSNKDVMDGANNEVEECRVCARFLLF